MSTPKRVAFVVIVLFLSLFLVILALPLLPLWVAAVALAIVALRLAPPRQLLPERFIGSSTDLPRSPPAL